MPYPEDERLLRDQDAEVRRFLVRAAEIAISHPRWTADHIARDALKRPAPSSAVMRTMAERWLTNEISKLRRAWDRDKESRAVVSAAAEGERERFATEAAAEQSAEEYRRERSDKKIADNTRRQQNKRAEEEWEVETYGHVLTADEHSAIWREKFLKGVQEYENSIRLEVTAELLASGFNWRPGERVTWGDATVEQHETYATQLEKMGVGTLETAGRHRVAVKMITEAGVATLRQVASATSPA